MINIRKGTEEDMIAVSQLLIQTWQNSYKGFIPESFLSQLNLESQIKRHVKYFQNGVTYLIAESDCNLIGFASYGMNRIDKVDSPKELYTIYVNYESQGNGIGKALLNKIIQDVKTDTKSISVLVYKENPYRSFYTKNGFEKIKEVKTSLDQFVLITEIYTKTL
ncbi:MAG: GNAT family N-acetyltransferase [Bacteroidota bacterium]